MKLKDILHEILLQELSPNSTLYHRSMKKMKVGDVIKPKVDKTGSHWLESNMFEIALESWRQKKYSDKPSRFKCVYCSVIPRSRFKDKGYLYSVKPVGNMLITDSIMIDKMGQRFDREFYEFLEQHYSSYKEGMAYVKAHPEELHYVLDIFAADRYWKGTQRGDKESLEVLCDSAIVTEVHEDKPDQLLHGDTVTINTAGKVYVTTSLYFEEDTLKLYDNKDKKIVEFVNNFTKLYDKPKVKLSRYDIGGGNIHLDGFLKKGTKLHLTNVSSSMRKPKGDTGDYSNRGSYKYDSIMMNPYLKGKLYKRGSMKKLGLLEFRMEYLSNLSGSRNIHDVGQYMTKK